MEQSMETARRALIRSGLELELHEKIQQAKMSLFASLSPSQSGKILAGSLTDIRFETHNDLLQSIIPFERIDTDEEDAPAVKTESQSREEFMDMYKDWIKEDTK